MSGGHFDYLQYHISQIADQVACLIDNNNKEIHNEYGDGSFQRYSNETIAEFVKAHKILKQAFVYTHRIDYLVSGDDGEETFMKQLKQELEELE